MDKQVFFANAKAFRSWLDKNHTTGKVLWVCYYKKHTNKASITWNESVAEALCFGWIDGLRKSIDKESYKIRFTPRRKNSIWSRKNIETVEKLIKEKRMQPAGLVAFALKKKSKSQIYNYEQSVLILADEFERKLKSNTKAWEYFEQLQPSVKKPSVQWVMTAKREETRKKRFAILLESCQHGKVVPPLRWTRKKPK